MKKFSLNERNFFTCGILKQFFSFIFVQRFGYDFVLILGWFHLDTLLAEGNFSLDLYAFEILKI